MLLELHVSVDNYVCANRTSTSSRSVLFADYPRYIFASRGAWAGTEVGLVST